MKMNEQMFVLLAIAWHLCPMQLEEQIQTALQEKCADRIARLQASAGGWQREWRSAWLPLTPCAAWRGGGAGGDVPVRLPEVPVARRTGL